MPIVTKNIPIVDDARHLSYAAYFGMMITDAGEQSTLTECVLSLARQYTASGNPEDKSMIIENDRYKATFEPDGEYLTILYVAKDTDKDWFITMGGLTTQVLMTSWDIETLEDFVNE